MLRKLSVQLPVQKRNGKTVMGLGKGSVKRTTGGQEGNSAREGAKRHRQDVFGLDGTMHKPAKGDLLML
jgi:hypothetical protein